MKKSPVRAAALSVVMASAIVAVPRVDAQTSANPPQSKRTFSGPPAQSNENPTFKVDVKLVSVFVTVNDARGAPVTDLHKDDFELREDGIAQKIAVFEQQSEVPLSIVMELDTSGSVRKDFSLELDSAKRFIASIVRPQDRLP